MAPRINQGAFGPTDLSAAAGRGARQAALGAEKDFEAGRKRRLQNEEAEYVRSERARIANERVYQREEDFYVATDIPDAGLGYESGLEESFREQKSEYAKIAAKGADATPEERAKLREFKMNIGKVSQGQNYMKKLVADYKKQMDEVGAISASTPPKIAQLLKDMSNGAGEFRPVVVDGQIRLKGKDSAGNEVDYSYDQLSSIKFSPKYDLNKSLTDDVKLIGNTVREEANAFGGSAVYTNRTEDIQEKVSQIAQTRLSTQHALYEAGAELGYDAVAREKIVAEQGEDAFRNLVTQAYTDRLLGAVDTKVDLQGAQVGKAPKSEFTQAQIRDYEITSGTINRAKQTGNISALSDIDPTRFQITTD